MRSGPSTRAITRYCEPSSSKCVDHLDDPGMVEPREQPGLDLEAVRLDGIEQPFDRDAAAVVGPGAVDGAHRARGERRLDLVATREPGSRVQLCAHVHGATVSIGSAGGLGRGLRRADRQPPGRRLPASDRVAGDDKFGGLAPWPAGRPGGRCSPTCSPTRCASCPRWSGLPPIRLERHSWVAALVRFAAPDPGRRPAALVVYIRRVKRSDAGPGDLVFVMADQSLHLLTLFVIALVAAAAA